MVTASWASRSRIGWATSWNRKLRRISAWRGTPRGCEGQGLAWVQPEKLDRYHMPAPDRPVVASLLQPDHCLVTPLPDADDAAWCAALALGFTSFGSAQAAEADFANTFDAVLGTEVRKPLSYDTGARSPIEAMVARIVRDIVVTALQTVSFDKWVNRGGAEALTGKPPISEIGRQ